MLKVVLDANIFVSAIINPKGKPGQIVFYIEKEKLKLITSWTILEEVERVLFYPKIEKYHKNSREEVKRKIERIKKFAQITPSQIEIKVIENDSDDDKYIVCAIEGQADYIISGDGHLTDLKIYKGIEIITPSEFLALNLL